MLILCFNIQIFFISNLLILSLHILFFMQTTGDSCVLDCPVSSDCTPQTCCGSMNKNDTKLNIYPLGNGDADAISTMKGIYRNIDSTKGHIEKLWDSNKLFKVTFFFVLLRNGSSLNVFSRLHTMCGLCRSSRMMSTLCRCRFSAVYIFALDVVFKV